MLQSTRSFYLIGLPVESVSIVADVFYDVLSQMHDTRLIRVWLGSYMGIYLKLLQIVQDQRKALRTAEKVSPLLCIRNMLEFIIKPDVFATRPWPQKGGYYVCLAMLF